jgi:hypothetical protein
VPTRLKKLRINRIDLVDRGAAPDARIALYKRQEPLEKNDEYDHGDYTPQTVEAILAQRDAKEAWWELTGALEMSVRSIMECADPSEAADLLTQTVNEFSTRARKLLPGMAVSKAWREAVDEVEKAGRVIAGQRLTRIKDAISVLQQIVREAEPAEKGESDMAEADVAKRAEQAEARIKELEAQIAKADDVTKRLEAAEQRAQDAEAVAKRNQERLEEREYIEKAQQYTALPVKAEEDWRVLKAIDAMEPSVRDRALELLAAAEGQLALAGALTKVGGSGERRGGGSALADAMLLAKGLVQKGEHTSETDAMQQVWREHPGLYERYRKEATGR